MFIVDAAQEEKKKTKLKIMERYARKMPCHLLSVFQILKHSVTETHLSNSIPEFLL